MDGRKPLPPEGVQTALAAADHRQSPGNSAVRRRRMAALFSGSRWPASCGSCRSRGCAPGVAPAPTAAPARASRARTASCSPASRRMGQGSWTTQAPAGGGQILRPERWRPAQARWGAPERPPAPAAGRRSWGRRCTPAPPRAAPADGAASPAAGANRSGSRYRVGWPQQQAERPMPGSSRRRTASVRSRRAGSRLIRAQPGQNTARLRSRP